MTSTVSRRWPVGLTNILADSDAPPPPVQVKNLTQDGIELADGLLLPSSCIFLNGRVFLWDVPSKDLWKGWTSDMFLLFEMVDPKPEILILGTGLHSSPPPVEIRRHLSKLGISLEIMDARNACSTYNLLVEEGRTVAAALILHNSPPWRPSST